MDSIEKFLLKLTKKQQQILTEIMLAIHLNETNALNVKKLVNEADSYRVRSGNIRIIYKKTSTGNKIINIDFRGNIYKK
jgi:mRNA-degrading endonuclease RelE of RelBE toxin-antitoxin system